MIRKMTPYIPALGLLAIVATLTMAIDWSSFTDALTAIVPDAVALAAVLVAGALTIAVVFKGGRAVLIWATRFIR